MSSHRTSESTSSQGRRGRGRGRRPRGDRGNGSRDPRKNRAPEFPDDFLSRGKIPELIEAVRILKKELGDEVPIVAGIIGPFTVAGSILDTVPLLKATFKTPEKIRPFLDVGEKAGTALAKALIDAGFLKGYGGLSSTETVFRALDDHACMSVGTAMLDNFFHLHSIPGASWRTTGFQ